MKNKQKKLTSATSNSAFIIEKSNVTNWSENSITLEALKKTKTVISSFGEKFPIFLLNLLSRGETFKYFSTRSDKTNNINNVGNSNDS